MNVNVEDMASGREQFEALSINHELIQDYTNLFYVLCSPLEGECYHALTVLKRLNLLEKKGMYEALQQMVQFAVRFNRTTLENMQDEELFEDLGLAMDEVSDMVSFSWEYMENDYGKAHVMLMNIKILAELMFKLYCDMRAEINPKVKGTGVSYRFPDRDLLYRTVKLANTIDRLRKKYLPKLTSDTAIYLNRRRQSFDALLKFGKLKKR